MRIGRVEVFRQVLGAGLKSFAFTGGGGSGEYGGIWGWVNNLMPSSEYDYRRGAGLLWQNSVVLNGLKWEADAFTEAPFAVYTKKGKTGEEMVESHPLIDLIQKPNPYWDEVLLMQATRMSFSLDGNAYWYKVRSAAGKVVELWWVPHWMIEPAWNPDGTQYLGGYRYKVNGKAYVIPAEDIVHFRDGIDPGNYRKGLSRLSAVLKEICTDNERATFSAAVLRNGGVPSVIISPAGNDAELPGGMSPKDYAELWMAKLSGDRRGEPFVSEIPIKIEKPGFSPADLVLDKVSRIPESRISGALRIPAIVLGLEVGLEHATYSNYEAALKAAYHHNVVPAWKVMGRTVNRQLMPELGGPKNCRAGFDKSDVQALQDDESELSNRSAILYKAGVAKRSEAKELAKLPFDMKADDLYITDLAPGAAGGGSLGQAVNVPDGAAKEFNRLMARMLSDKRLTDEEKTVIHKMVREVSQRQVLAALDREIEVRRVGAV